MLAAKLPNTELCALRLPVVVRPLCADHPIRVAARYRPGPVCIRPAARELANFAEVLDKMLSDNINRDFFQNDVPYEDETTVSKGRIIVAQRRLSASLRNGSRQGCVPETSIARS